ncbi:MAG: uracil-DNA glycosylase [Gemmatimonadetes bacterium]|jgi:DNA polymerase|nr:uracil-DNA glycosylase [Gemmatimonadota bacterium]MBT4610647.1 uracil-DNA glycosylase [Gemmatimonadota bacterium]MBT5055828.1 uracil-DNA glycosylase [Gemmatimonadota bacterium]MBT5143743.1 uracil-DNA glycosylase [Gemmatimonadota bacterium]MBT5590510.1 uracil-DNA glycosylase [Gemmatimonadota bacterium]
MDPTSDAQVSPQETLRQVRRALEDLVLFEGRQFIAPADMSHPAAPDEAQVEAAQVEPSGEPEPQMPEPMAAEPDQIQAEPQMMEAPPTPQVSGTESLEGFRQQICECTKCELGHTRNHFVFGAGRADADILFVGEAPGADEDRQGEPFVGAAGQLLTKIIEAMGLRREDVFICNLLKCRPPNNRDPLPEEVASCEPYLKEQIRLVAPKVICCLGKFASQALLRSDLSLSRMRGQQHTYEGIPLVVTYHPAALLRNASYKRDTWEDVKTVRRLFDGVEL